MCSTGLICETNTIGTPHGVRVRRQVWTARRSPGAWLQKGAQAFKNGKLADAGEQLRIALDHDPELARAHYFMGLTLGRVPGREREALRHLESATRLEPNNTVMKAEAASAYLASGMSSRAERLAQEVLSLDPTNSKAQTVLELVSGPGSSGSSNRKG